MSHVVLATEGRSKEGACGGDQCPWERTGKQCTIEHSHSAASP